MNSKPYTNLVELNEELEKAVRIEKNRLIVDSISVFRGDLIDRMALSAIEGTAEVKEFAAWIIWEASQFFGCGAMSLHSLYNAMQNDHVKSLSVPCIELNNISYEEICIAFNIARGLKMGALSFEAVGGVAGTTERRPNEYASQVLAAAVKTGWNMPVFLYWSQSASSNTELILNAIEGGFFNFDEVPKLSRNIVKTLGVDARIVVDSGLCLEDYVSPLGKMYPPLPENFGRIEDRGFRTILSIDGISDLSHEELERRFVMAFERLGNRQTVDLLRRHVIQMPNHRPRP
jgi:hypothetical protein